MRHTPQNGFIALISAIIISVLLLTITVAISLTGIFGRFNVLDSESKERSIGLAEACADSAILEITAGIYSTNEVISVGPTSQDVCTIKSANQTTIKTQAFINKAYTNLVVVIDSDYKIVSWEEVSNF